MIGNEDFDTLINFLIVDGVFAYAGGGHSVLIFGIFVSSVSD